MRRAIGIAPAPLLDLLRHPLLPPRPSSSTSPTLARGRTDRLAGERAPNLGPQHLELSLGREPAVKLEPQHTPCVTVDRHDNVGRSSRRVARVVLAVEGGDGNTNGREGLPVDDAGEVGEGLGLRRLAVVVEKMRELAGERGGVVLRLRGGVGGVVGRRAVEDGVGRVGQRGDDERVLSSVGEGQGDSRWLRRPARASTLYARSSPPE